MRKVTVWAKKERARLVGMNPKEAERFRWPMILGQFTTAMRKNGTLFITSMGRRYTVETCSINGRTMHPTGDMYYEIVSQP